MLFVILLSPNAGGRSNKHPCEVPLPQSAARARQSRRAASRRRWDVSVQFSHHRKHWEGTGARQCLARRGPGAEESTQQGPCCRQPKSNEDTSLIFKSGRAAMGSCLPGTAVPCTAVPGTAVPGHFTLQATTAPASWGKVPPSPVSSAICPAPGHWGPGTQTWGCSTQILTLDRIFEHLNNQQEAPARAHGCCGYRRQRRAEKAGESWGLQQRGGLSHTGRSGRESLGRGRDPEGHGGGHGWEEPRGREGAAARTGSPAPRESPRSSVNQGWRSLICCFLYKRVPHSVIT